MQFNHKTTVMVGALFLAACGTSAIDLENSNSHADAAASTVRRSTMTGTSIQAGSWGPEAGFSFGAWQARSAGKVTVSMNFGGYENDASSWLCTPESSTWCEVIDDVEVCHTETWDYCRYTRTTYRQIWAENLPEAGIRAVGTRTASVALDLAGATGSFEICTWQEGQDYTCEQAAMTGTIALEFDANNLGSGSNTGSWTSTSGRYSFRQRGTWRWARADFVGTVLGGSYAGEGEIATGNNVSIERYPRE